MPKPVSNEKRALIVKHIQAGEPKEDIAKWLFICVRTVERVWSKYPKTGHYKPEPLNCGRKPKINPQTMENIITKIKEQPDLTLLEIIEEFNLPLSQAALCKRLKKRGLTFKKDSLSKKSKTSRRSGRTRKLV